MRRIVVIGAGPAGLAAATEAVRHRAEVILIDEGPRPGGQIYRQSHPDLAGIDVADPAERSRKERLLAAFAAVSGRIDYRPSTVVHGLIDPGEVLIAAGDSTERLRADAVVVATGLREVAAPFPGWTTPGVMYAGAAQSLIKAQRVLPGRRVVVAGAGPLPMVVAAQILRAGGTIAALAPLHGPTAALGALAGLWHGRRILLEGLRYAATVARARAPIWTGFVPVAAEGGEALERVVLARLGPDGPLPGSERRVACDVLAVNYGFAANSELPAMAGARMRYDRLTGGWLAAVDELGRTSIPGLFVAGDAAGLRGALVAEAEGRIVGAAAAQDPAALPRLPEGLEAALRQRQRLLHFQDAVRRLLATPAGLWRLADDDTIVCRCENVRLRDLRSAFAAGHHSPNAVKRVTRLGMGWCGGRTCLPLLAGLAERNAPAQPASEAEMVTPRPLARPVAIAALAQQKGP